MRAITTRGSEASLDEIDEAARDVVQDAFATVYLFVDPKTSYPLEYRVTDFGSRAGTKPPTTYYRIPAVRRFRTFERLPATPANLRPTSIEATHPTAKVYPP